MYCKYCVLRMRNKLPLMDSAYFYENPKNNIIEFGKSKIVCLNVYKFY